MAPLKCSRRCSGVSLLASLRALAGQPAAGSLFRVVALLLRDALRLSHNKLNLPFPEGVVNSGVVLGAEAGIEQTQAAVTARLPELIKLEPRPQALTQSAAHSP